MKRIVPALFSIVLLAACAAMAPAPATMQGDVLVDKVGMTLYTFDKDAAGSGNGVCNGPCAKNWPPLIAAASDTSGGDWAVISRDDGAKQWAYKGRPLYLWVKDQKPGDKTGEGVLKVWHVAKP